MKRNMDDVLREAIESSGYYEYKDTPADLRNEELTYKQQVPLILARELVKFRPDLLNAVDKDVVFIVCNGSSTYSLPSVDLTALLENEKPYSDAIIGTYSLSERKLVKKLYKGDGTKWIPYKGASK